MALKEPLLGQPLLPQLLSRPVWAGYDADELRLASRLTAVESAVAVVLTLVYVAFAWALGGPADIPPAPAPVLAVQLASTLLTLHVMYVLSYCVVYPTSNQTDLFGTVSGPLGRYVFLTRQTLAWQTVHFVLSALAPLLPGRLAAGCYALSVPLGGLCLFVTVQFFTLARPAQEHLNDCAVWAARGVHYKFCADYVHVPAGILAALDVVALKERSLLLRWMPSLGMILLGYVLFVAYYMALIHANKALTGFWPYGILKKLGKSIAKWARFMIAQLGVLTVFVLAIWTLPHVVPATW